MAHEDELKQNLWLRRESGEGWREGGIDEELLGHIVWREKAADQLDPEYVSGFDKLHSDEMNAYRLLVGVVNRYKQEHNISDPPPLPPEDD